MANSFEKYIGQSTDLDKVLCALMTSGVLETPEVQYVERGEFKIPVLEMDGLGNYDKATGFSSGNVSLTFETKKRNYERSKSFEIDAIDDMETMGVVTGIVQEFQFGMNWSGYSRFVGDIFGAPLAIEALVAFFIESTFLGVWIFGWEKL